MHSLTITLSIPAEILHSVQRVTKEIILPSCKSFEGSKEIIDFCDWASSLIYVMNQTFQMAKTWTFGAVSTMSCDPRMPQLHRCSSRPSLISALQDHWLPVEPGDFGLADRPRHLGDCRQLSGWVPGPQYRPETEALLILPLHPPLLKCLQKVFSRWRLYSITCSIKTN